jgi:hypothetical protein
MSGEQLRQLMENQPESGFFSLVGNEQILNKVFSFCARGYTSGINGGEDRIPVMRVGTSGKPCLYIAGIRSVSECECLSRHHAALLVTSDEESAAIDDCRKRFHMSVHLITHQINNLSEENGDFPPLTLVNYTFPHFKEVLSTIFINLTKLD